MVSRVTTIAFEGIEAIPVDVQVMVSPGKMGIQIVGLADKAVAASRERVQAALHASGLSMPAKKVTVNLAPADLPKEGSHYDLPIALGLMAAIGAIPRDALTGFTVLGELGLDGRLAGTARVDRRDDPRPAIETLRATGEHVEAPTAPASAAHPEETDLVLAWLEQPGTWLVEIVGEWSAPVRSAQAVRDAATSVALDLVVPPAPLVAESVVPPDAGTRRTA